MFSLNIDVNLELMNPELVDELGERVKMIVTSAILEERLQKEMEDNRLVDFYHTGK